MSDLFGSDLPVEGKPGWCFEWRDGPFLKALRSGDWIILDEVSKMRIIGLALSYSMLVNVDESCIAVCAGGVKRLFGP